MFLKKINYFLIRFVFIIFILKASILSGKEIEQSFVNNYIDELKNFSSSFIQDNGGDISEGKMYIGKKRVRLDYNKPANLLIVLDEDKAMYYNYDLEEVEFFNPQKTTAWFFFEIFKNKEYFSDADFNLNNNNLVIQKSGVSDGETYDMKINFETSPLILRKIELKLNNNYFLFSLFDHKYNESFHKKFFKLIRPKT
tara:strand:- start:197 stop:787 length:591 start_codon:yes stop_codon:yes gene_type:complete